MGVAQLIRKATVLGVVAAALGAAGCGEVARTGRSPGFLVMERLEGASGADPEKFTTVVGSDVQTLVRKTIDGQERLIPTIFMDPGRVVLSLAMKNPGTVGSPTEPSALNAITVNRYRVVYRRSDGRNTQGTDVPYAFDGGMTVTVIPGEVAEGFFELVRVVAKRESPLIRMVNDGGIQAFSTIAEVSFFGRDQAGNEVTVSGTITVSFADYGDPD
jgi:hypothetical protein